jgi:hypothetical protein
MDENSSKPDSKDIDKLEEKEDFDIKYVEEGFVNERLKILNELGLIVIKNENDKN